MNQTENQDRSVIIIGGGAAGVLVATQLLKQSNGKIDLTFVEPAAPLGQGAAYSTPYEEHLLNVVAGGMSAFAEQPDDFVRFLKAQGRQPDDIAVRFAPRRDYGRYLRHTLEQQPGYASVQWERARAVDVDGDAAGGTVVLDDGRRLSAAAVVLALGNAPKGFPVKVEGQPHSLADAWDYAAIGRIPSHEAVAILGSGLSMVDVVVHLVKAGHSGQIHVISRHGLLPLPHDAPCPRAGDIDTLLPLSVGPRMRLVRQWAKTAQADGEPWQWTIDRLRPHVQRLWLSWTVTQQQQFLRHAVRYWDIHRHRIAPQIHAQLMGLIDAKQLQVHAGHVAGARGGQPIAMELRLRQGGQRALLVDRLVNATGVHTRIERSPNPVVQQLLAKRLTAAGPHGIGLATDEDGRLRCASGDGVSPFYTLGSARIGQLWESIAIPELRGQAAQIARCIVSPSRD